MNHRPASSPPRPPRRGIPRTRRMPAALGALAVFLTAAIGVAPAAWATLPPPEPPLGPSRAGYPPVTVPAQIHTVVTGGMPGWQITLIAAGAALLAAILAVLLDRARTARRHAPATTT
jgi:hypothetical protein